MQISSDFDLEANYGYRFVHANIPALYGEIEFVALPNRSVTTATAFLGLRAEVRDFVSGNPNLNVALSSSTQHNVISSGGIIVRF